MRHERKAKSVFLSTRILDHLFFMLMTPLHNVADVIRHYKLFSNVADKATDTLMWIQLEICMSIHKVYKSFQRYVDLAGLSDLAAQDATIEDCSHGCFDENRNISETSNCVITKLLHCTCTVWTWLWKLCEIYSLTARLRANCGQTRKLLACSS